MKLKYYIDILQKIAKENPCALEFELVSSSDDEGNSYNNVHCDASLGVLDDGEYQSLEQALEHWQEYGREYDEPQPNAICVN